MKRFLKTIVLLVVSLFFVVSGVDAALDRLAHSPAQGSLTVYDEQGGIVLAYDGDLSGNKPFGKLAPVVTPGFFHRT